MGPLSGPALGASELEEWREWLERQDSNRGRPLTEQTRHNIALSISAVLTAAAADTAKSGITENPWKQIAGGAGFAIDKRDPADTHTLSADEVERLAVAMPNATFAALTRIGYALGLRSGELRGLSWTIDRPGQAPLQAGRPGRRAGPVRAAAEDRPLGSRR
jgi:integrase